MRIEQALDFIHVTFTSPGLLSRGQVEYVWIGLSPLDRTDDPAEDFEGRLTAFFAALFPLRVGGNLYLQ